MARWRLTLMDQQHVNRVERRAECVFLSSECCRLGTAQPVLTPGCIPGLIQVLLTSHELGKNPEWLFSTYYCKVRILILQVPILILLKNVFFRYWSQSCPFFFVFSHNVSIVVCFMIFFCEVGPVGTQDSGPLPYTSLLNS